MTTSSYVLHFAQPFSAPRPPTPSPVLVPLPAQVFVPSSHLMSSMLPSLLPRNLVPLHSPLLVPCSVPHSHPHCSPVDFMGQVESSFVKETEQKITFQFLYTGCFLAKVPISLHMPFVLPVVLSLSCFWDCDNKPWQKVTQGRKDLF